MKEKVAEHLTKVPDDLETTRQGHGEERERENSDSWREIMRFGISLSK